MLDSLYRPRKYLSTSAMLYLRKGQIKPKNAVLLLHLTGVAQFSLSSLDTVRNISANLVGDELFFILQHFPQMSVELCYPVVIFLSDVRANYIPCYLQSAARTRHTTNTKLSFLYIFPW